MLESVANFDFANHFVPKHPTHELQLKNGSMFGEQTVAINSLKRSPSLGEFQEDKIASPPGLDDIRRSVLKAIEKASQN